MTEQDEWKPATDGTIPEALWEALREAGIDETWSEERIGELTQAQIDRSAEARLSNIEAMLDRELRVVRRERAGFEARLARTWGGAFDLLEAFAQVSLSLGSRMLADHGSDRSHLFQALNRLHARGLLVSDEILALLRAGHASGANARWRTLHELAVIACFIRERGEDVAERYLLHNDISRAKGLTDYERYADQLGLEHFTDAEAMMIRERKADLIARYGKPFGETYGWAADALANPNPNLRQIQDATNLGHWQPAVGMAHSPVHAGSHSLFFDLGSPEGMDLLRAGPSNLGLADPGMSAALSLNLLNIEFLILHIDFERAVGVLTSTRMATTTVQAFADANDALEDRIDSEPGGTRVYRRTWDIEPSPGGLRGLLERLLALLARRDR